MPYVPTICTHCQAPLPAEPGPGDPEPTWHQVAELPELAAEITEHQGHARTCPGCGHLNRAEIPPEVRAHVIGPRLAAVMSYFSGRLTCRPTGGGRGRRDGLRCADFPGAIVALEAEMCAALAGPYQEAEAAVRAAPVKDTDETGWSEKGQKRWLWTAATATVAFFVIHLRRSFAGLKALLGETLTGVVCSDRWSAYSKLPLELRQQFPACGFLFDRSLRLDSHFVKGVRVTLPWIAHLLIDAMEWPHGSPWQRSQGSLRRFPVPIA